MNRRGYLSVLGSIGLASLAGCVGDSDSDDPDDGDDGTANPDDGSTDGDGPDGNNGSDDGDDGDDGEDKAEPTAVVEDFYAAGAAGDRERAIELLHSKHPLHPENVEDEDFEFEFDELGTVEPDVEATVTVEDPSMDDVSLIEGAEFFLPGEGELDPILDGGAVVVETAVDAPEGSEEFLTLLADDGGQWRILWQGQRLDPPVEFERRAIDTVEIDGEAGQATVTVLDEPTVDELAVESTVDEATLSDPAAGASITVDVAIGGGELQVWGTLDGEERLLHRERHGDRRIVEGIEFEPFEDEQFGSGLNAEVRFTGEQEGERLEVESLRTRQDENWLEPAGSATFLTVPVDESEDEIVVRIDDGEEVTEVHRERFYFENDGR